MRYHLLALAALTLPLSTGCSWTKRQVGYEEKAETKEEAKAPEKGPDQAALERRARFDHAVTELKKLWAGVETLAGEAKKARDERRELDYRRAVAAYRANLEAQTANLTAVRDNTENAAVKASAQKKIDQAEIDLSMIRSIEARWAADTDDREWNAALGVTTNPSVFIPPVR